MMSAFLAIKVTYRKKLNMPDAGTFTLLSGKNYHIARDCNVAVIVHVHGVVYCGCGNVFAYPYHYPIINVSVGDTLEHVRIYEGNGTLSHNRRLYNMYTVALSFQYFTNL